MMNLKPKGHENKQVKNRIFKKKFIRTLPTPTAMEPIESFVSYKFLLSFFDKYHSNSTKKNMAGAAHMIMCGVLSSISYTLSNGIMGALKKLVIISRYNENIFNFTLSGYFCTNELII